MDSRSFHDQDNNYLSEVRSSSSLQHFKTFHFIVGNKGGNVQVIPPT